MLEQRRELFERLKRAPGGTAAVVEIRRRLLAGLKDHPAWAPAESDLGDLLRIWFEPGALELRRIDESAPPAVLDHLIKCEAVHKIQNWRDLRRRLQADRRCYALFHPDLPSEPVIFTELALTSGLDANVQPLLDPHSNVIDPASCDCAIFYSISSCHEGLRGVPFGTSLIRRVVETLGEELPSLTIFGTLSPIPGFRAWLTEALTSDPDCQEIVEQLTEPSWPSDPVKSAQLRRVLVPLCASYLLFAKRGREPVDAVARFHLGNGARLERLNWLGDTSVSGMERSIGLTVNYLYAQGEVERNQQRYLSDRTVTASRRISNLAQRGKKEQLVGW